MSQKKYVISSIIPNATYSKDCLETLKNIASDVGAELLLLETAPNFVSDTKFEEYVIQLDEIKEYLVDNGMPLGEKLSISPILQNVNVLDPILGMDSLVAKIGNLIVPFPRHRMKMVSRMLKDHKAPRGIWCTGTISDRYYKQTKSGITAAQYHVYGGIVVEINEDETFSVRQLTWDGKSIYDMTTEYTPKSTKRGIRAVAVSLGDLHAIFASPHAIEQSEVLIKQLNPTVVIQNDVLDVGFVGSHHLIGKNITKGNLIKTLAEEGEITSNLMNRLMNATPDAIHYFTASNHPEHLDRWLEEGRFLNDPNNIKLGLELALVKSNGKNAAEHLLRKFNNLERWVFCERNDSLKINDIELLCHGDSGAGGSRGTPNGVSTVYGGNVTTAHSHSPQITPTGSYVVGTLTELHLSYQDASAGNNWAHANVIQYENGTRCNYVFI
jgi:hypothetical protein